MSHDPGLQWPTLSYPINVLSSHVPCRAHYCTTYYYEGAFVAEGDFIEPSAGYGYGGHEESGTSTLPTPTYTTEPCVEIMNPVMKFRGRGHTPAPRLPIEDRGTKFRRPGWSGRPPVNGRPRPQYSVKKHGLICFHCYEKRHAAPTCILSLREMHQFLGNYEALSPMNGLGVPSTSYLKVQIWFDSQTASTPSASANRSNRPSSGPAAGPGSQERKNPQQQGNYRGESRRSRERHRVDVLCPGLSPVPCL